MTSQRPPAVPRARGRGPAITLALLTHGLLAVFLFFGIRWQSRTPDVIQAELWSTTPQTAAPETAAPAPVVAPPPAPIAQPEPAPAPLPAPDIAIRNEAPKKEPPKKITPPPPPPKPIAKPEVQRKPVTDVAQMAPKAPSDLDYLRAQADAKPSTGTAAQSAGPSGDPGYDSLVRQKVLSNMHFPLPANLSGNPEAVFAITFLPTGEINSVKMVKSSGIPGFDAAVGRAIDASAPFPKRKDGSMPFSMELVFKPLDKG
jgi:colicin import membrane protein